MKTRLMLGMTAAVALAAAAFVLVPPQAATSPDPWAILADVTIEEEVTLEEWKAVKTFSDELEQRDGTRFQISGYGIPIDLEATITSFILVSDPQDCPFCGSSGYGPVLEVLLSRGIPEMPEFAELTVEGTLVLNRDTDTYQMYRLEDAIVR